MDELNAVKAMRAEQAARDAANARVIREVLSRQAQPVTPGRLTMEQQLQAGLITPEQYNEVVRDNASYNEMLRPQPSGLAEQYRGQ